jgi:hypothetical protein
MSDMEVFQKNKIMAEGKNSRDCGYSCETCANLCACAVCETPKCDECVCAVCNAVCDDCECSICEKDSCVGCEIAPIKTLKEQGVAKSRAFLYII